MTAKEKLHLSYATALGEALMAGVKAAEALTPTPMIVGTPKNMMASLMGGDDGGFDPAEPTYYVADGVCGFAWVQLKGSLKFQNWLLGKGASMHPASAEYGDFRAFVNEPRKDSYYGGVSLWIGGYGQSHGRKVAFAHAFAASLSAAGIDGLTVYAADRLD